MWKASLRRRTRRFDSCVPIGIGYPDKLPFRVSQGNRIDGFRALAESCHLDPFTVDLGDTPSDITTARSKMQHLVISHCFFPVLRTDSVVRFVSLRSVLAAGRRW